MISRVPYFKSHAQKNDFHNQSIYICIGETPACICLSFMKLGTLQPNADPTINKNIHLFMIGKQDLIHCDQEGMIFPFSLLLNIEPNTLKLGLCLVQNYLHK